MDRAKLPLLIITYSLSLVLLLFSGFFGLSHLYYNAGFAVVIGITGCWISDVLYRGHKPTFVSFGLLAMVGLFYMFTLLTTVPFLALCGFLVFGLTAVVAAWPSSAKPV